jgi:hypothetical protein
VVVTVNVKSTESAIRVASDFLMVVSANWIVLGNCLPPDY